MQLTDVEKAICARTEISESEYAAQKARNAIRPMSVGIGAQPIVQDATRDMSAADIVREAIKELESFVRDPEHMSGMQFVINASGLIDSALRKVGAARRDSGGY